jgi:hypothetical protein
MVNNDPPIHTKISRAVNTILVRNVSAYRIVDGLITEVTSEAEIQAIQNALDNAETVVNTHLRRALELFSDRKNPDYRNSIKWKFRAS